MNYTISMTDILLAVSVGCNLWFLFLLLYERIMDMRLVRFFKGIAGLWRSLDRNEAKARSGTRGSPCGKGGHHRQEPFQDGIHPDNRCHTDARSRHYWKKALSCRRKRLLLTTEKRETHPARHKSRRKNSMRPSRAYRRRNWDTGTTNRKRTLRTRHGLRAAALTRLTTPARPPRTRTRHRRNVKRRRRCSPTWRARSCTRK